MRKILLLMAVLLPLSLFGMNDENEKAVMKIPLEMQHRNNYGRTLPHETIECYYYGLMNTIITNVFSDLGDVTLTVTNHSTGEVWYDVFDSEVQPQVVTTISGVQGCYEIIYETASKEVYRGLFEIN